MDIARYSEASGGQLVADPTAKASAANETATEAIDPASSLANGHIPSRWRDGEDQNGAAGYAPSAITVRSVASGGRGKLIHVKLAGDHRDGGER